MNDHDPNSQRLYDTFAQEIRHESDMLNQRVIWHVISQSFFFGAYTTLLLASDHPRNPEVGKMQEFLYWALPIIGFFLCLSGMYSVFTTRNFLLHLKKDFKEIQNSFPNKLPKFAEMYTPIILGPSALPVILTLAWIVIIGAQIF